jgi:aerotolerance regulator-like protein/VWA domain-containing protein
MNFLFPAFLLGGLAIAIPIVLHLLRRDVAPEVPFTAVRLLRKSPVERSRRRRLRDLLLLAARVVALLLLAAAFARPYSPRAEAAATGLRIVAIDRSFSMGAPGRFERALELARTAIDEARFAEPVAVLAFDERADVIALPGSPGDARAAVAALKPGPGATRYASVLDKASELAAGGAARLVLVTDLQRAGWEGESHVQRPASLTIEIRDAGSPADNLAVAGLRADRERVVTSIRNSSNVSKEGTATLSHDGTSVGRMTFTVGAGSSVDVPFSWTPSPAGALTVSIEDPGGFAADNARFAVMNRTGLPTVMVIASTEASGFYVLRAMEAADATVEVIPVTAAEIAGGRAESIARQSAVLLLSTRNLDRAARDATVTFVRSGGGLMIAAAAAVEPQVITATFGWNGAMVTADDTPRRLTLSPTDIRHPIFQPFGGLVANLGQVSFSRAWRVRPEGWHVAAQFSDGTPALLERAEGQGRVVLFASDLDRRWNDFPLHPAFVPFVIEALRHVSQRPSQPHDFVVSRTPSGVPPEPGVHRTADGRMVAVNVDPRESATAVMSADEFLQMIDTGKEGATARQLQVKAAQAESRQNLWQYGLLLMLATLVAESFVGRVQ